jgi:FAD/FMN-containing dehydrogenase
MSTSRLRSTRIPGFSGELITAEHSDFDRSRQLWNALFDRRPYAVARCASNADVVAALAFARAEDVQVAVRCGGHSLSGRSVIDDGLVIDLAPMNQIRVDPVQRRARVQGGCLLGALDRATQEHGLAVPVSIVSHTGVGGLVLGGGMGHLMRRYGLSIDSLVSADVVTADGSVLRPSAEPHPDLYWGLRGGGGNFGVVTEFEFELHEVGPIYRRTGVFRLDRGDARAAAVAGDDGRRPRRVALGDLLPQRGRCDLVTLRAAQPDGGGYGPQLDW